MAWLVLTVLALYALICTVAALFNHEPFPSLLRNLVLFESRLALELTLASALALIGTFQLERSIDAHLDRQASR